MFASVWSLTVALCKLGVSEPEKLCAFHLGRARGQATDLFFNMPANRLFRLQTVVYTQIASILIVLDPLLQTESS